MIIRSPYPDVAIPVQPLTSFVLANAADQGDKPALIDGASGRRLTYAQLVADVRRLAVGLTERGFARGDVFAIYCPNLPEYAVAFLGVAALGGIITTANPLYTADELAYQLADTGALYLLTTPQLLDTAREAVARCAPVREIFVLGDAPGAPGATPFAALLTRDGPLPATPIDPWTDLVALPYSSGTSGRPKGVMLTHYNLVAQLCQFDAVQYSDETMIAVLPFFHIYGMMLILLLSLWHTGTLVMLARFDLEQFLRCLQDYGIQRAPLVPPVILALAKHPLVDAYTYPRLRIITAGAASLGAALERACAERLGCIVLQGYGMTETAGATHVTPDPARRDDGSGVRAGSCGPTLPNMETLVADLSNGQALGPHEQGEIWLRGPNVMQGYLNQPEATAQTLDADGWLHTGDVGYVDEDGYLYVVDRVKELIKYNAYQVAPAELEALLVTHPAIADAAVIPSPDEETGEAPKAVVVLRAPLTPEEIIAFVTARVAPYKKVRRVEIVEAIPRSTSGKILRRVLIERERAARAALALGRVASD